MWLMVENNLFSFVSTIITPSMKKLRCLQLVILGQGIKGFCPINLPKIDHLKSSK